MKIFQMVPSLEYGDAIGNDIIALADAIEAMGYETKIYAVGISKKINDRRAESADNIPTLESEDIVIYHYAIGNELNYRFAELPAKKVIVYHNVTPPEFFERYNKQFVLSCVDGKKGMEYLADKVDYAIADSAFNADELKQAGYKCPIEVLPILIKFSDYEKQPDAKRTAELSDGKTNILFVGRLVPNKAIHDIISAFACYKKYYNPESRLVLAGSQGGLQEYYDLLLRYVDLLNIKDIIFTGHIRFEELLSCYRTADLFLCQSEHEGFCVPLVESMYFNIPIVAYSSTAIPDTLSGAGIVLDQKSAIETAAVMNRLLTDETLRMKILDNQRERLQFFQHKSIVERFKGIISNIIKMS